MARDDMDKTYRAVGTRIREIREAGRITQAAVAEEAGLTRQSVANIEKGRQRFLFHTLLDIARALQVEPNALIPTDKEITVGVDLSQLDRVSPKTKEFVLSIVNKKSKRG